MIDILWPILLEMRTAFSNQMTFMWFCSAILGLAAGCDDIGGMTSINRNLNLGHRGYSSLTRLFNSRGINHFSLSQLCLSLVIRRYFAANAIKIAGRLLVVVDATKVAKRGKRMPGVIGMKDTANDCWMRGHYFEQLCIVVRGVFQLYPVPIAVTMLAGIVEKIEPDKTLADRCRDFITAFPQLQACLIVGDAWYSKSKLIIGLARQGSIAMVTRVAHNAVARMPHLTTPFDSPKRGRKRKYAEGPKIKLFSLFEQTLQTWVLQDNRGQEFTVQGWCRDLKWEPLGLMVRIVGIHHPEKGRWILMSSDTSLSATEIAQAYVYRFWIEVGFHTAKSLLGAFTYRFWSKSIEKLSSFPQEIDLSSLSADVASKFRQKVKSIEFFTVCSMIAQGLLVFLSINHGAKVAKGSRFWMRTKRGDVACERSAAAYIQIELLNLSQAALSSQPLEKFIQERQDFDKNSQKQSEAAVA